MPNKHTATLPDGTIGKRVSQRRYSHCIATRPLYDAALARAKDPGWSKTDASNFRYDSYVAAQQPDVRCLPPGWCFDTKYSADAIERAKADIAGCASVADYLAKCLAARIAQVEADKVAGRFDRWTASAWASRLDLANKTAGQYAGAFEVRIVPVVIAAPRKLENPQ